MMMMMSCVIFFYRRHHSICELEWQRSMPYLNVRPYPSGEVAIHEFLLTQPTQDLVIITFIFMKILLN